MQKNGSLRILTQSALLIAAALVIKILTAWTLPGVFARINMYGIFSQMIPILFGPLWGGVSGAVLDLTAWAVMREGGLLPHITVIEILCGMLLGFGWKFWKAKDSFSIFVKSLILILSVDIIHSTLNSIGFAMFIPTVLAGRSFMVFWSGRIGISITFAVMRSMIIPAFYTLYARHIKESL